MAEWRECVFGVSGPAPGGFRRCTLFPALRHYAAVWKRPEECAACHVPALVEAAEAMVDPDQWYQDREHIGTSCVFCDEQDGDRRADLVRHLPNCPVAKAQAALALLPTPESPSGCD